MLQYGLKSNLSNNKRKNSQILDNSSKEPNRFSNNRLSLPESLLGKKTETINSNVKTQDKENNQ